MEFSPDPLPEQVQIMGFSWEDAAEHYKRLLGCGYVMRAIEEIVVLPGRYLLKVELPHAIGINVYLCWPADVQTLLRERCYLPIHSVSPSRGRYSSLRAAGQWALPEVQS